MPILGPVQQAAAGQIGAEGSTHGHLLGGHRSARGTPNVPGLVPGSPRGGPQERSRRTRQLVLDAAVRCLEELGYAGTTTVAIQQRAGVSRGRLLHHFPSRDSLLLAALDHLATERFRSLRIASRTTGARPRTLRRSIDLLWMTHEGPLFWAANELWLAARHDEALRGALDVAERRIGAAVHELCDEVFGPRVASCAGYAAFRDLLVTSMRGVALTYAFHPRPFETERHRETWYRLAEAVLGETDREATPPRSAVERIVNDDLSVP